MKVLTKSTNPTTTLGSAKTMLIYGETQSGKTSLLGTMARALHQRTGKITRLILCDEGGPSAIQPEIDEGIIEVVDLVADEQPQSNLMWLAKGAWPGVNGSIDQKSKLPSNVGMVALDSLTSAASLVINHFVQSGLKIAQDIVALREEQGLKFGNAAPAHYGAVQQFILQLITQMGALPCERVVFTALESKAEDQVDKSVILGPLIAGKALTGVIPSRMNRLLHLEIAPSADRKSRTYRIYFQPHVDPTLGRVWPANLRLPLKSQPIIKAHPIYGKGYLDFQTGDELLELLTWCEELVKPKVEEKPSTKEGLQDGISQAPDAKVPTVVAPTTQQRITNMQTKPIFQSQTNDFNKTNKK